MISDPKLPDSGVRIPFANALAEPDQLLAAYFSSPTVGLAVIDSELRFVAVNETLAAMNGISAEAHLRRTLREVLGEFASSCEPLLHRVLLTGQPVSFEMSGPPSIGSEPRHWLLHYIPIKNHAGSVTAIGAVVLEITAQKQLEESLHDTNQRLEKQVSRARALLEISNLLASHQELQQIFPKVSEHIRSLLAQEYAGYALRDASTGMFSLEAVDFQLGQTEGAVDPIAATHEAVILSKGEIQEFDRQVRSSLQATGIQSVCSIPLVRPKGSMGVLVLGSTREQAFEPDDLALLNQVAAQLAIAIENAQAAKEIEDLKQRLAIEHKFLEGEPRLEGPFAEIIGESPALKLVLDHVETVAPSDATVLLLGETGTGKELIARAIHQMSGRKHGPFIKVNCAAIPTGLLESELFGHEKGAFTGAISQKIGRMELAHGGTLLLDEIGEVALDLQPKLLRVLQDHEFERLGGTRTINVNVRIIASTNRNLAQEILDHHFRSDLFYRLNVFPIRVPPLRERPEDVPPLVRRFVNKFALRMGRNIESIPIETMKALQNWEWPGNVRELENLMERSVILSEGSRMLQVPLEELRPRTVGHMGKQDESLDAADREHIIRVLRETGGLISGVGGAAARLGLKRTTLQSKMRRLGISRKEYLPATNE